MAFEGDKLAGQLKELFRYGIAGLLATMINIVVYVLLAEYVGINYLIANAIAWVCAFLFAFFSNKNWVFKHNHVNQEKARKEFAEFLGVRLFTAALDMIMIWLFVGVFSWNGTVSKIIDNIVVIAVNYVASKFFIFK